MTTTTTKKRTSPGTHHLRLMLVLTFCTGIIDAVGFLGLDRVFTGNMTGNVVILGMGLAGADDLPVLGPALALVGFMAGAAVSGLALARSGPGWTHVVTALFAITAVVELITGVGLLVRTIDGESALQLSAATVVAAAMGVQAAAARHLAVKDVTTVVVTSTITGLAADSMTGAGRSNAGRRAAAVVLILAGAGVGAALLLWHIAAGFVAAGVLTAAAAGVGGVLARDRHAWTQ